ncbi:MAG: hypothetical protein WCK70_18450 [Chloroflexales bacterium]|jgi:hypothetical protein
MWMTRTFSLLTLMAVVLLTPVAARATGPSLTAPTPRVTAGEIIWLRAEGFIPGERIVFWTTAPNQAVLSGDYEVADHNGYAEIGFRVPSNAISGTWAITAYGSRSATPVVAFFTVVSLPGQGDDMLAAVAPEVGPPGTTFSFAATGFNALERASYWFTAPDGSIFAAFDRVVKSNDIGRVDISWASPTNAPHGTWVLTIQGINSNVARGIPFHIE